MPELIVESPLVKTAPSLYTASGAPRHAIVGKVELHVHAVDRETCEAIMGFFLNALIAEGISPAEVPAEIVAAAIDPPAEVVQPN